MIPLDKKVIDAYTDGSELKFISECFNMSVDEIIEILIKHKESSRYKKTFTDEFRTMIAERDLSGFTRNSICKELKLNANTVRNACEKFGQTIKDKSKSSNEFRKIEGNFGMNICPSCNSFKVNEIDEKTVYCKSCGGEFIYEEGYVLQLNWEYLD